jgi:excisionase family DNA binding protein
MLHSKIKTGVNRMKPARREVDLSNGNREANLAQAVTAAPSMRSESERLLTKEEVAVICHVTTRSVENWMARGALQYMKIGRSVRFRLRDVEVHVASFYRGLAGNNKL